jgi:hypothetical protein
MPSSCRVGYLLNCYVLLAALSVLMSVFAFQFATLNVRVVGYYVTVSTEAADIMLRSEGFVAGI